MELYSDCPLQFKPVVLYLPGHGRYDKKPIGFEPKPLFQKVSYFEYNKIVTNDKYVNMKKYAAEVLEYQLK
jgi:hypothetical protein